MIANVNYRSSVVFKQTNVEKMNDASSGLKQINLFCKLQLSFNQWCSRDPATESTISSQPPNPNDPEVSNQSNYSANVKIIGPAEQEEEDIEVQDGNFNNGVKQTCQTLFDMIKSDLNTTNRDQFNS